MNKLLPILFFFTCCSPKDGCEGFDWIYQIEPELTKGLNTYTLVYNYPDQKVLQKYVNEMYFNRYDISIDLVNSGDYPVITIKDKDARGCYVGGNIEIRPDRLYTSTISHEIGHALGLGHYFELDYQNLMRQTESDCAQRYFLNEQQIKKVLE